MQIIKDLKKALFNIFFFFKTINRKLSKGKFTGTSSRKLTKDNALDIPVLYAEKI